MTSPLGQLGLDPETMTDIGVKLGQVGGIATGHLDEITVGLGQGQQLAPHGYRETERLGDLAGQAGATLLGILKQARAALEQASVVAVGLVDKVGNLDTLTKSQFDSMYDALQSSTRVLPDAPGN